MIYFWLMHLIYIYAFPKASATEVSVETYTVDRSLDLEVHFPVLTCHVRHTGYTEVSWYKDYVLLKRGSAKLSDHFLPLASLMQTTNSSDAQFEHPLKLQGYYWCETEHTKPSSIFDYLFRIEEVHTFVGKFLSARDSLGDHEEVSLREKKAAKRKIYEEEMQNILFAFLPVPSVYVTDVKQRKEGLEVRFFLYVRQVLHPRKPTDSKLVMDQHHLDYIREVLNNETSTVDPQLYYEVLDWTDFRGISVPDIRLKSTLGCYEETTPLSNDSIPEVTWKDARIGDIVISDNACLAKNGLAVTRICTGSFFRGATWGKPSGSCSKLPEGVTEQLKEHYDAFGTQDRKHYIDKLVTLTKYPSEIDATGLHIVTEILKELSKQPKLDLQEINNMLSVVNQMVETNRTQLDTAKNLLHLTSRILKILDNILEQASEEDKEIKISKQHILMDTKYTNGDSGHILGFAVLSPNSKASSLANGSIAFIYNDSKPIVNAVSYFVLPEELVESREALLEVPCQVNMVFFKEWYLFQAPKDVLMKRHYKLVPTPVIYASLSGGPAWNLTNPVDLYFKKMVDEEIEDPVCVYYDDRLDNGIGAWSSEGCEYGGLKHGFYNCRCHHLSIFAVILSINPDTSRNLKLGSSIYVGCGVSFLALSFAVILFILSKSWRQTIDHKILFCLSLTYLICLILIFISEMHFLWKSGCMPLALIFHYTVFAVFGWLLVQAIVYKLRFTKKTDVNEIPHFMTKACFSVWGSPIIIVIIIWLSREYTGPVDKHCWITVSEVSLVSVIPMIVLMLVTLSVNVCATYAVTCRFRKDFLIGESNYNETVVKFRVAFTIFIFFVLSWLFGFFALQKRTKELQILFSISFTLTAYYVMLFFVFQEISFWDLFHKWEKKEEPAPPVIKYEPKSYQTIEELEEKDKN